jgi:hypothetical protein
LRVFHEYRAQPLEAARELLDPRLRLGVGLVDEPPAPDAERRAGLAVLVDKVGPLRDREAEVLDPFFEGPDQDRQPARRHDHRQRRFLLGGELHQGVGLLSAPLQAPVI